MLHQKLVMYCIAAGLAFTVEVTAQSPNYDETKIPAYALPDPLLMKNGRKAASVKEWNQVQRPAIYKLFEENVYGRFPKKKLAVSYEVTSLDTNALNGLAIRKEVTVYFLKEDTSAAMDVLLYIPKKVSTPVPVFLGLNFCGNHCTSTDVSVKVSERWIASSMKGVLNNRATDDSRGSQASQWPVNEIISRGYGVATIYYGDLEPDHAEGWKEGIRTRLSRALDIRPEEWSAMGAWAWGLNTGVDYLEKENTVDADNIILLGHSRLGKAALWAAATDTRYAVIISNEAGEGGAALSKRYFGETIKNLNQRFPHWFAADYKKYNDNAAALPVDQHMLLALVAPRPLYVSSAEEDRWADPKGEFLSLKNAEPVYKFFDKRGLGTDKMPDVNQPIGEDIRYHIRAGKHDITDFDWQQYLDFADHHLKKKSRR